MCVCVYVTCLGRVYEIPAVACVVVAKDRSPDTRTVQRSRRDVQNTRLIPQCQIRSCRYDVTLGGAAAADADVSNDVIAV